VSSLISFLPIIGRQKKKKKMFVNDVNSVELFSYFYLILMQIILILKLIPA